MRDRRGARLTVAVIVGGVWAAVQALITNTIAGIEETSVQCAMDLPKDDLALVTWGAVIAVFIALGAAAFRWRRVATVALLIEVGFVVAWIVIGGFAGLQCAYAV